MNIASLARNTSTAGYIVATAAASICALVVRASSSIVPYSMTFARDALEWLAIGLFLVAYLVSWALIPIGVLRPVNRFTLKGDKNRRIINVLLATLLVVAIHVAVGLGLAAARS